MKQSSEMYKTENVGNIFATELMEFLVKHEGWGIRGIGAVEVDGVKVEHLEVVTPQWRGRFADAAAAMKCLAYEVQAQLLKEEEEERNRKV